MSAVDEIAAYLAHLKTGGNRIDQIIFDELPNGEEMTATDELRRLLDERGVEWREHTELQGEITLWNGWQFFEGMASYNDGYSMLSMVDATPEQAVEATLGRGTCRMEKRHMDWRCTGCGEIVGTDDPTSELFIDGNAVELWRYCPNCGRRIEVDA